jgi:hypothetical protein
MNAELAARVTAARAADSDFENAVHAFLDEGTAEPVWQDWAWRLSSELRQVLAGLDRELAGQAGKLDAIRAVLDTYNRDAIGGRSALERIEQIAGAPRNASGV